MSTTTLNGSDPTIFLTNGTRTVLGLEGESTRSQSIVQAAQDAFYQKHGVWPYVDGMPNVASGSDPEPEPEPDPEPEALEKLSPRH